MALADVKLTETFKTQKKTLKTRDREYRIDFAADDDEALLALLTKVPATINGMTLDKTSCQVEEFGTGVYLGTTQYVDPQYDPTTPKKTSFSYGFNIGTQSITLKHSFSTRHKYTASGATARDFKGAINVDGDGNVNGVEIQVPVISANLGYSVDPSLITDSYVKFLSTMVGKVNSDAFKGHDIGSLLLTSVTGSQRDGENWDLNFGISISEKITNFTLDGITGIEKYGWEYLWAYYEVTPDDSTTKFLRPRASNAYVEQVYRMAAFSGLGLP